MPRRRESSKRRATAVDEDVLCKLASKALHKYADALPHKHVVKVPGDQPNV